MSEYEELRRRHLALWMQAMPGHLERLRWPAERLKQERELRLRALIEVAIHRSPWHRGRLRGIDPATFREQDLPRLEPMTKDDLMSAWDEIVTEPRLNLALAERHLAGLRSDAYLLDEFHVVASGGSSGRRGVFVYGWESWATANAGFLRTTIWDRSTSPELAGFPNTVGMVAAERSTHMTSSLAQTFANPQAEIARFPVTSPLEEIVQGLNRFQPTTLLGYATALGMLIPAVRQGELRISPKRIFSTSEPLLPEVRRSLEEAFGAPVANMYGTSEAGPMAIGCWRGPGMHLCDDLVIVEPVDERGRPVPPGVLSDKVYVTAISNPTLPLIRFELTDQVQVLEEPCACGSAHRLIADVQGRLDDVFVYPGGVSAHPHVFRSILGSDPAIIEYQVRQTERGAEVLVVGKPQRGPGLERAIAEELTRLGLPGPQVRLSVVDRLQRQSSGKMRRFLPLANRDGQAPGRLEYQVAAGGAAVQ